MMKTVAVVTVAAGLVAAQVNFTNGHYECALPHQVYCLGDSLTTSIILRCDESTLGQMGNCNDNLAGEPPMGNTYSSCWQTSNITGDAACSKNCVVYGSSGNHNGTFTLPAEVCTPTYTATSSPAASTLTQSVTVSSSSDSDPTTVGTVTTTVCTESESSTTSTGAVTDSLPSSLTTSTTSVTATADITQPTSSISSKDGASTPPAGSTASEPSSGGSGPVVTSTSTSSVAAVPTTSFPTAGAVANHVGVGLGVMGLLVGAVL